MVPGQDLAHWLVFIMGDDEASVTLTMAVDEPHLIRPDLTVSTWTPPAGVRHEG